jgi:arylsulfatase A-like enzyme
MTSLYSSATGVWFLTDGLHKNFLTLPEIMRSQGFETVSIIENLDAGLIAGLNQGFDCISMETDTATLLNKTQEILGTSKRNLFIYLHLMNPHSPNPPERFRFWYDELRKNGIAGKPVEKNSIFDPPWVDNPTVETRRALYDGAIRSNDVYLQEFIEKLKNLGILDNTLFIFTADHGEFLGEYNQWLHGLPGFIQVVHVPLIMVYPKTIPAQKRIHQNVQLLDIMPTILDFAHIDKKDMLLQGDSLIPLIQEKNIEYWNRRLCYSDGMQNASRLCSYEPYYEASLFFDNFHLLKSLMNKKNAAGFFRIFDFISNPQEERDLSREDAENLKVESEFTDFISTFQKINSKIWEIITEKQEGKLRISQNEIQRLKNLGYLQ